MTDVSTTVAPTYPTPCSIEIFRRSVPGNVVINYYVSESRPTPDTPYPDPVDIIAWDEAYYIVVVITLEDPVRRLFCGYLCVDVDVDTCGPAPDLQFPEKSVLLDPCGTGTYPVYFELPANTFAPPVGYPNRCGRIYRICITVGSFDLCTPPNPGLIWGHCDSVEIAVHPPVPTFS